MKAQVYSLDGTPGREITLADEVFNIEVSDGAIYHALRNELANLRVGTASTKQRGEVHGSKAKPWRQKGTGRARAGHKRSPLWVGGGTVFGPQPRDYSYRLPRKVKRLAIKSVLTRKAREDRLKVVENFSIESGKTRDLVRILKILAPEGRTVIILGDNDPMLKRAGRNIPGLHFLSFDRLRVHDLFYGSRLLLLETAAAKLNEFYGQSRREHSVPASE
jgi:large subunit ribosomal protein L4